MPRHDSVAIGTLLLLALGVTSGCASSEDRPRWRCGAEDAVADIESGRVRLVTLGQVPQAQDPATGLRIESVSGVFTPESHAWVRDYNAEVLRRTASSR